MKNEIAGLIFKDTDFQKFDSFIKDLKQKALSVAQNIGTDAVVNMASFSHDVDVVNKEVSDKNYLQEVIHLISHDLEEAAENPNIQHPLNFGFVIYYKLIEEGFLCLIKMVSHDALVDILRNFDESQVRWCNYSDMLMSAKDIDQKIKDELKANKLIWDKHLNGEVQMEFHSSIILMPNLLYIKSEDQMASHLPSFDQRVNILARDMDIQRFVTENKVENDEKAVFSYYMSEEHTKNKNKLMVEYSEILKDNPITIQKLKGE